MGLLQFQWLTSSSAVAIRQSSNKFGFALTAPAVDIHAPSSAAGGRHWQGEVAVRFG